MKSKKYDYLNKGQYSAIEDYLRTQKGIEVDTPVERGIIVRRVPGQISDQQWSKLISDLQELGHKGGVYGEAKDVYVGFWTPPEKSELSETKVRLVFNKFLR